MTTQPTTKGGNIILRRIDTPNRVEPGEGYEVDVKVSNGALVIQPWDADSCGQAEPGYKVRVVAEDSTGDRQEAGPTCLMTSELGTGDETFTFEFQAPTEEGEHEVEAWVEMVGSGKETDPDTSTILVNEEVSRDAPSPGNDDGNTPIFGGVPTGSDPSGSNPLGFGGTVDKAVLLLGLLVVAWLANSASDTVEAVA
ncbi:hypothetical protein [Halolamina sp. C58]|uniref:hypothetical protein n=1 Tax=Halolamina sp. C58 TaxID=3421640 RepID=UPI003EB91384